MSRLENPYYRDRANPLPEDSTASFQGRLRCGHCQGTNDVCAIRKNAAKCESCEQRSKACHFTRTTVKKGSKADFGWSELLGSNSSEGDEKHLETSIDRLLSSPNVQPRGREESQPSEPWRHQSKEASNARLSQMTVPYATV